MEALVEELAFSGLPHCRLIGLMPGIEEAFLETIQLPPAVFFDFHHFDAVVAQICL